MGLWEELKQCRKALADAIDLPPYVIFHDATLLDMVHYRPLTEQQLLAINGVGQRKLEKYGADFLRVIKTHDAELV
jgi:ATP-dependent DNA helicase RecQ